MITAIIPTLNEEKHIKNCLMALVTQTHPPDEIIVVDSGSTDKTVEIAGKIADKVLTGMKNIGYNRELGVNTAKGDIILSTDGDTILEKHWIELGLETLSNPDVNAVCGKIEPLNPDTQTTFNCAVRSSPLVRLLGLGVHEACLMFKKNNGNTHYFCDLLNGCPTRGEIRTLVRNLKMNEYGVIHNPNMVAYTEVTDKNLSELYVDLTLMGVTGYQIYKKKGLLYNLMSG